MRFSLCESSLRALCIGQNTPFCEEQQVAQNVFSLNVDFVVLTQDDERDYSCFDGKLRIIYKTLKICTRIIPVPV
jgi:hypothetical protein